MSGLAGHLLQLRRRVRACTPLMWSEKSLPRSVACVHSTPYSACMHSTGKPVIRLRRNEWDRRMNAKNLATPNARAERLGFSRTTVARIEKGETKPGYEFIAAVLDAFPDVRFEDVFEVGKVAS